jgi:hypothetical protein
MVWCGPFGGHLQPQKGCTTIKTLSHHRIRSHRDILCQQCPLAAIVESPQNLGFFGKHFEGQAKKPGRL